MIQPDFLRPFWKDNRKEAILVQFHGVLVNTNFGVLRAMIKAGKEDPSMMTLFPTLKDWILKMKSQNAKETVKFLETMCALFPPGGYLFGALSSQKMTPRRAMEFYETFLKQAELVTLGPTLMCATLTKLADAPFLTDLYIQVDTIGNEAIHFIKAYVEPSFQKPNTGNLHLLEGAVPDILEKYPNITTCFIQSAAILDKLERDGKRELLRNRDWIFPVNFYDFDDQLTVPKDNEKFLKWQKEKFCEVGTYYHLPPEYFYGETN